MSEQAMTVEIDEAIRRDPVLLADVEAATESLRRLPADIPTLGLPEAIRWRLGDGPGRVELTLSDAGPPPATARRQFAANLLATGQLRELSVLRTLSNFLSVRSAARPSIESLLLQLLENLEGADAAKV